MNAKATPRPWRINGLHIHGESIVGSSVAVANSHPDATLIVKAVNEYEALNAVAEAAERFRKYYFDDLAKSNRGFLSKFVLQDYEEMMAVCIALPRALNALATVRAKEVA